MLEGTAVTAKDAAEVKQIMQDCTRDAQLPTLGSCPRCLLDDSLLEIDDLLPKKNFACRMPELAEGRNCRDC